eukprot:51899-Prymnesium_polylepis.1
MTVVVPSLPIPIPTPRGRASFACGASPLSDSSGELASKSWSVPGTRAPWKGETSISPPDSGNTTPKFMRRVSLSTVPSPLGGSSPPFIKRRARSVSENMFPPLAQPTASVGDSARGGDSVSACDTVCTGDSISAAEPAGVIDSPGSFPWRKPRVSMCCDEAKQHSSSESPTP